MNFAGALRINAYSNIVVGIYLMLAHKLPDVNIFPTSHDICRLLFRLVMLLGTIYIANYINLDKSSLIRVHIFSFHGAI